MKVLLEALRTLSIWANRSGLIPLTSCSSPAAAMLSLRSTPASPSPPRPPAPRRFAPRLVRQNTAVPPPDPCAGPWLPAPSAPHRERSAPALSPEPTALHLQGMLSARHGPAWQH